MRCLARILLLFSLVLPAYAVEEEMYIIVGSFSTKERAEAQRLVLQKKMAQHPDIVDLSRSHYFLYTVRKSGGYHRTAIGPFFNMDVLEPVMEKIRVDHADAFISRKSTSKATSYIPADSNLLEILLFKMPVTTYVIVSALLFFFVRWWLRRRKRKMRRRSIMDKVHLEP